MARQPYQWSGGTEEDRRALAWFSSVVPEAMGPRLARFRCGATAVVWVKALLLALVSWSVLVALVLLLSPEGWRVEGVLVSFALAFGIIGAVMVVCALVARFYRHDVHRHGLVVRSPVAGPKVIPWGSIDPGRIFIGSSIRSILRMPVALHRQRAVFPPAVMINGWTNRPRGRYEAFEQFSADYHYRPRPVDSPFGWWQLGVTDPRPFLAAIESAMVADGYPAGGLTSFVLSRRFTARGLRRQPSIQHERRLEDPVIGLPWRDRR